MQPADKRFEEIYRRNVDAVLAYARRRAPADMAEDVAAETFLICWRRLDRVPENALPWLYAVARKTLANQRRAAVRRATTQSALEPSSGAGSALAHDPTLRVAFARLGERDQELLALVAWEGLSLREAAASLGCSPVACRVRFHRAKRRLAQHLEQLDAPRPIRRPHAQGVAR